MKIPLSKRFLVWLSVTISLLIRYFSESASKALITLDNSLRIYPYQSISFASDTHIIANYTSRQTHPVRIQVDIIYLFQVSVCKLRPPQNLCLYYILISLKQQVTIKFISYFLYRKHIKIKRICSIRRRYCYVIESLTCFGGFMI